MKILVISDFENQGGASIVGHRFSKCFAQLGHDVTQVVYWQSENESSSLSSIRKIQFPKWSLVNRVIKSIYPSFVHFNARPKIERRFFVNLCEREKFDRIYIHNLHGAEWSHEVVRATSHYAPVFWTLHDMWSFTARCAYTADCTQFLSQCTRTCPTFNQYPSLALGLIPQEWQRRKSFFEDQKVRLRGISPSHWLANEAKRGLWRDRPISVIKNGLPESCFLSISQIEARQKLNLPLSTIPYVLLSSNNLNRVIKGSFLAKEALENWKQGKIHLLLMGNGNVEIRNPLVQVTKLGFFKSDFEKSLVYAAADLFILPSLLENLANVTAEALACGTPTVAFEIGGNSDMIHDGVNGVLCGKPSAENLRLGIEKGLDIFWKQSQKRQAIQGQAHSDYSLQLRANDYLNLNTV